jgi:hypothetical protein
MQIGQAEPSSRACHVAGVFHLLTGALQVLCAP